MSHFMNDAHSIGQFDIERTPPQSKNVQARRQNLESYLEANSDCSSLILYDHSFYMQPKSKRNNCLKFTTDFTSEQFSIQESIELSI